MRQGLLTMARGLVELVRDAVEAPPQRDAYHRALIEAEHGLEAAFDFLAELEPCLKCEPSTPATRFYVDIGYTRPHGDEAEFTSCYCDAHAPADADVQDLHQADYVRAVTKALARVREALR